KEKGNASDRSLPRRREPLLPQTLHSRTAGSARPGRYRPSDLARCPAHRRRWSALGASTACRRTCRARRRRIERETVNEATERVDLRRYLWPLVHRRALVLTFVVSATVSSLLLTYVASEKYEAAITVL